MSFVKINSFITNGQYTKESNKNSLIGNIGFGEIVEIDVRSQKKILITAEHSFVGCSFVEYAKEHYGGNFLFDTISTRDDSWKNKDFSNYDIVFHVAGLAHSDVGDVDEKTKEKYYEVNTNLTVELANKAKKNGVGLFIFISSIIVYGDSAPMGEKKIINEETVPSPDNFYGDSKLQADVAVRSISDNNFKVIVLRPPMIYGKGCKGNYPTLSKIAKKIPIFPNVDNERSMIHIDNLCEFICQVMLIKKIRRDSVVLFPQNEEWMNTSYMVKKIAETMKKKIHLFKRGTFIIRAISKKKWKISNLINKAFGNCCYDKNMSLYEGVDYFMYSIDESIVRTEVFFDGK